MFDSRLKIHNLVNETKIQVIDYTSDHQALLKEINIKDCTDQRILQISDISKYNHKHKWKKFQNQ